MTLASHPKTHEPCPGCGTPGPELDWERRQRLPQVGQTYECPNCGEWVFVFDNSEHGMGDSKTWKTVSKYMAATLQFFDEVGEYPDAALDEYHQLGLGRYEAIDYYMTEEQGLSQSEWAERRAVSQQAVSENVAKARERLE